MEATHEELRDRGVEFSEEASEQPWGLWAQFKDPDGNELVSAQLEEQDVRLMSKGFNGILADSSPRVRDLAPRTRALIRDVMPDVVEVPGPRQKIIGYDVAHHSL